MASIIPMASIVDIIDSVDETMAQISDGGFKIQKEKLKKLMKYSDIKGKLDVDKPISSQVLPKYFEYKGYIFTCIDPLYELTAFSLRGRQKFSRERR